LKIVERGDLAADQMIGPFAGELGQFQFLRRTTSTTASTMTATAGAT
jgi:membrane-bound lytic murein transglycosylase B